MSEPVIVLDPGEERAQLIARALSSRTAGRILESLSDGPRPLSDIAENLSIPLPKAKYHITNLLEAGILEITAERYSVKGRRVKVYGLKQQVLVVAPRKVDLKAMLFQYSSVFTLLLSATLVLGIIRAYYLSHLPEPLLGGGSLEPASPVPLPVPPLETLVGYPAFILMFLLGGCLVVAVLVISDCILARKGSV